MSAPNEARPDPVLEQDDRFPSGPWTGFFLQKGLAGRQWMELDLTFAKGILRGDGRDRVGKFLVRGRYEVETGKCRWTKRYIGQHDIDYAGYNEGKGIWGTWEWPPWPTHRGGFRIWPVAMGDPTQGRLAEASEEPAPVEAEALEVAGVGVSWTVRRTPGPTPRPRGRRRSTHTGRSAGGGRSPTRGSPA